MADTLRFIQIAAAATDGQSELYGLTADGRVYCLESGVDEWTPLPMESGATLSPRDVAAYLLDCADQYDTESPCRALSDAAENVLAGEVQRALGAGELDQDLYARLDRLKAEGRDRRSRRRAGGGA